MVRAACMVTVSSGSWTYLTRCTDAPRIDCRRHINRAKATVAAAAATVAAAAAAAWLF